MRQSCVSVAMVDFAVIATISLYLYPVHIKLEAAEAAVPLLMNLEGLICSTH